MTAKEYLASGQPDKALLELQNEIRAHPEDPKLRIFLFQLHCVLGNWTKALTQLQVIAGIDPDTMPRKIRPARLDNLGENEAVC